MQEQIYSLSNFPQMPWICRSKSVEEPDQWSVTTVLSSTQGSCPQCKTFSLMQAQVYEKADAAAQECTCLAPRCCCCCCTNWLMALRCALCTKYVLAVIGALSTGACTDKLRNARIFSAAHPAHPAHTKKLPLVWGSFSQIYFPVRFPNCQECPEASGFQNVPKEKWKNLPKSDKVSKKVIKSPKKW